MPFLSAATSDRKSKSGRITSTMEEENKRPPFLFLVFYIASVLAWHGSKAESATAQVIQRGFSVTNDPGYAQFQPLLSDPTGVFSLGFLRVNSTLLDLAVLHLPSSLPLWRAVPAKPALWSKSTSLSFNGSLVLSDPKTGVFWSSKSDGGGRLVLLNSSNLQIQKLDTPNTVLWQSFDFPSDTIVQDQNFTSMASLFSSNQQFSMRLGENYLALYMVFNNGKMTTTSIYWKHTALEAKAEIVPGDGPIYARVESAGFLGMYQSDGAPADVLSFDTFNRKISRFRRLTLESDGNLRAYYWNDSSWVLEYKAISESCDLPTTCGAYELCGTGEPQCTCLANGTEGCLPPDIGDLCGVAEDGFWVLRRKGVDLANKDLLGYQKVASLEDCEASCERNCSCWGAVYSNSTGSGYCYLMDYPIEMLVEGDERKAGYFKVRRVSDNGRDKRAAEKGTILALLVVGCAIFFSAAAYGAYRVWNRKRRRSGVDGSMTEGLAPLPYKDLSSASFKSIELSNSFSK
ncbi:PAN domain-containing protein At5g03700 [Typha angustifolia]|uniref:PAN domain-containing protein At5g03700 n=1 Tax=Typha angustifolia TaxID=59011 RepID=UPI003C2EFA2F